MPPYQKNASMAQQRKMFSLAEQGKVPMADAIGRARASKGMHLPNHVAHRRRLRALDARDHLMRRP